MDKLGTYEYQIDSYLTDFSGNATLPYIGSLILQVATKHAEERGFGYHYMMAHKRAWVLSRMVIEMFEYPHNEDKIQVSTWVAGVNKLFTERYFSFVNKTGKTIGYAKTIWAGIDIDTRRPASVTELSGLIDFKLEIPCPIDSIKKILPIKDEESVGKFTIRYSDVDINNHLNSVKYIEHFVDMFDINMFKYKTINRFEIMYAAEALYGTRLNLFKKEEVKDIFSLEMRSDTNTVSTARVSWS